MQWVSSIFSTCCIFRKKAIADGKSSSLSLDVNVSFYHDTFADDPKSISHVERNNQPENTRQVTTFTDSPLFVPQKKSSVPRYMILCNVCKKSAQGYCPACPFKRYCEKCFSLEHGENIKMHFFVAYKKKRNFSGSKFLKRRNLQSSK
jgi:hypothetical protein